LCGGGGGGVGVCGGACVFVGGRGGGGGGKALLGAEQLCCSVLKLAVTLLQLSYRAACSNNQQCLKLRICNFTSVSTMLIHMPAYQFIIIAFTDGYTSFLSVLVSVPLPSPFVVWAR